jgi:hypothetical protein
MDDVLTRHSSKVRLRIKYSTAPPKEASVMDTSDVLTMVVSKVFSSSQHTRSQRSRNAAE